MVALFSFNEIWDQAGGLERIYWVIALPSSLVFLILLVTTFLGGGVDDDVPVDVEIESDHGVGVQFFTLKNMVGFFTILGWTGLACIKSGLGPAATVLFSLAAGTVMMTAMAYLFLFMSRMVQDGSLDMSRAVGRTANVYLRIPPRRSGMGKVQVTIQGALRELDAMTDQEDALATGAVVRVAAVVDGHILLVEAP